MLSEENLQEICASKIPVIKECALGRKIWIYGAGIGGKILKKTLQENNIEISGFVDKAAESIQEIEKMPVVSIGTLNPQKDFIVISLRGFEWEVVELCRKHGFLEKDIYYVVAGENYNKEDVLYRSCKVGRYTYGYKELLEFYPIAESIGRFCSINGTAKIWNNHPIDYVSTHPFLDYPIFYPWEYQSKRKDMILKYGKYFDNAEYEESALRNNPPVVIGNDVWVGANAIILPGVTIGDGAVIAAGAVVTHNVESYAIVAGVPAKVIKYRYNKEQVNQFLKIRWWDWTIEKIEENLELFYNTEEFLEKFGI